MKNQQINLNNNKHDLCTLPHYQLELENNL